MMGCSGVSNGAFPKACSSGGCSGGGCPSAGGSVFGNSGCGSQCGCGCGGGSPADGGNQMMSQVLNLLQMIVGVLANLLGGQQGMQPQQGQPLGQTGQDPLSGGTPSGLGTDSGLGTGSVPGLGDSSGLGAGSIPGLGDSSGSGMGSMSGLDPNSGLGTGSGMSGIMPQPLPTGSSQLANVPTGGSPTANAKLQQAEQIVNQMGDPQMKQALQSSQMSFTDFPGNQIGLGGYNGNSKFVQLDQPFVESSSPQRIAVLLSHELTHTMGGDENAAESVEKQWDNRLGLPYDGA